jgi:hypothetical protein
MGSSRASDTAARIRVRRRGAAPVDGGSVATMKTTAK